jgi:hypothetical protein
LTPKWLLLLAKTLSGQVLSHEGVLQDRKTDQAGTISLVREELDRAPADDPWAEWGRWFLADPFTRTISPYSRLTMAEYIDNRLKEHTDESLALARRAAEGNVELMKKVNAAQAALQPPAP